MTQRGPIYEDGLNAEIVAADRKAYRDLHERLGAFLQLTHAVAIGELIADVKLPRRRLRFYLDKIRERLGEIEDEQTRAHYDRLLTVDLTPCDYLIDEWDAINSAYVRLIPHVACPWRGGSIKESVDAYVRGI
jgi:hypothetical protein